MRWELIILILNAMVNAWLVYDRVKQNNNRPLLGPGEKLAIIRPGEKNVTVKYSQEDTRLLDESGETVDIKLILK